MHGLFPKRVTDAVLDAMNDHGKLSMPLLENEETGRQFALLYRQGGGLIAESIGWLANRPRLLSLLSQYRWLMRLALTMWSLLSITKIALP
ncbi:hypothetical protein [Vreelandella aquamarina]|uniref:hypothetical protein n=1 Tax=Vreelandella aquamarina TaxID=77097 RepID=UPI00384E2A3C